MRGKAAPQLRLAGTWGVSLSQKQPLSTSRNADRCGPFEEDRRHFERGDAPAAARDAVKLIVWQVLADEFSLGVVTAFLQTEQVGVAGADAFEDKMFSVVPMIRAIIRGSVTDVEGHEGEHGGKLPLRVPGRRL